MGKYFVDEAPGRQRVPGCRDGRVGECLALGAFSRNPGVVEPTAEGVRSLHGGLRHEMITACALGRC